MGAALYYPVKWVVSEYPIYSVITSCQVGKLSECPVTWIQRQNIRSLGCSVRMSGHVGAVLDYPVKWVVSEYPIYSVITSCQVGKLSECPVTWIQRQNIRSCGCSIRLSGEVGSVRISDLQCYNILPMGKLSECPVTWIQPSECPVTWIQRQNVWSLGYGVRMSGHLDTASECPVTSVQCPTVRSRQSSRCFMFGSCRLRTSVLKLATLTENL